MTIPQYGLSPSACQPRFIPLWSHRKVTTTSDESSPSRDFSITFLAAPKLSLRERIASWEFRIHYILIVLFNTFPLICHFAAELLAVQVPYLELNTQNSNDAGWIGFLFFGDTPLLHSNFIINKVERTIMFTLVRSSHLLFLVLLSDFLISLNLFLGFWL